jgi:Fic family protein
VPREVDLPGSTLRRLGGAEAALGRLAGVAGLMPNADLLTRPYALREALFSTRIEGTRTTMAAVFEVDAAGAPPDPDVEEVLAYLDALDWGLIALKRLPLSSRLLREMHRRLMAGARGRGRAAGEFRSTQNWIGRPGSSVETAEFVPPPADELPALMADWERFANEEPDMPLLVQNALLHSQFETIYPFLDGNGRLGRLMLVFFLVARGRISLPLLYLSAHLEADRPRYYKSLQAIQERGDPIPWIELFLTAVETQSLDAVQRATKVLEVRERFLAEAAKLGTTNAIALVDLIGQNPVLTTRQVENGLGVTRPTALRLLRRLEERGVLEEGRRGGRGQRRYVAREMMAVVAGDDDRV